MGHAHGASLRTNFGKQLLELQVTQISLSLRIYGRLFQACSCSRMAGEHSGRLQPDPNTHSSGPGTTLPTAPKTRGHVPSRKSHSFPFSSESCRMPVKGSFILVAGGFEGASGAPSGLLSCALPRGPAGRPARPPGRCPFPA